MKIPPGRSFALRSSSVILLSFFWAGLSLAMPQDKPVSTVTSSAATQKPERPRATIVPSDASKRQAVATADGGAALPAAESHKAAQKEATIPEEDSAQKALEIAGLQKELKAKQERVELLMHLFVADEQQFVRSPTDPIEDPRVKERIRVEQEELRAQSMACARLKARLDALTAGVAQN